MLSAAISASDTTTPLGYWLVSSWQRTVRPVLVVVAEISSTITHAIADERLGAPVLAGRWLTTMSRPSSLASFWSSRFHNRTCEPLLPPPSAVISNRVALG